MKRSVSGLLARVAVRGVDCAGHDLCARREGRHEDLFRPADSRRSARRPAAGADLQRASVGASSDSQRPREEQLLQQTDDFRYESCTVTPENDTTFQNPEAVIIAVSTNPPLRPGDVVTMTVDGQPAGAPNSQSYTMSPVYRGTHTVGLTVANTERQGGLQFHFRVPRAAARAEFPRTPGAAEAATAAAAPHAALTTACTAGGLHGG